MSKFKQGKKLIICLLCLIITALALFFVLKIFDIGKKDMIASAQISVQDMITGDKVVSYDKVAEYHEFVFDNMKITEWAEALSECTKIVAEAKKITISTKKGFEYFADAPSFGKGKEIELLDDIDCEGEGISIDEFTGVFNGNGHTISNVKYTDNISNEGSATTYKYYSLFLRLHEGAIIQNLRVYNVGRGANSDSEFSGANYKKYIGGMVGYATKATIENCVVENFIVKTADKTENISVGGVFVLGDATVTNCLVKDMKIEDCGHYAYIGPADNYESGYSNDYTARKEPAFGKEASSFGWCVVDNIAVDSGTNHGLALTELSFTPTNYENGEYNHKILGECYDSYDTNDSFNKLSLSYWHIPPTDIFNDGWPYLKSFIDFKTYTFIAGTNGNVTVNGSKDDNKIDVPVEIISSLTISTTSKQLLLYDSVVLAEADDGYKFTCWVPDEEGNTYTAAFESLPIKVYVNPIAITHVGVDYEEKSLNSKAEEGYYIGQFKQDENLFILYTPNDNGIEIRANSGMNDMFQINSEDSGVNPNKNIWDMYTIKEFKINDVDILSNLTIGQTAEIKIEDLIGWLGGDVTLLDLISQGITIDVTFDLKSYGVVVK